MQTVCTVWSALDSEAHIDFIVKIFLWRFWHGREKYVD